MENIKDFAKPVSPMCSSTSALQSLLGQVPLLGDWIEQTTGGPSNPDFYRAN